jgi:alpha-tubulin suppressor-like RCC1 family protein
MTNRPPIRATTDGVSVGRQLLWILLFGAALSVPTSAQQPGALWATGFNSGQLGDGSTEDRKTPAQVTTGVAMVAGGYGHTAYVKTDGTLWTTGYNYYGQLGDGTNDMRETPGRIASGVATVSAGFDHTAFVKTDGTLWTVGHNANGQLGDGSNVGRTTAAQVVTGVAKVAAGAGYTLFIKTDGTLWAVGRNANGQLGIGSNTDRSTPVQVTAGVAAVSARFNHAVFLKTDGTLWAMGANGSGQLGDGTTSARNTPGQIATGVAAASAGFNHTVFVKTDGTLWTMGANTWGQLGDGTTTARGTPGQVATGVVSASGGWGHTVFVKTDGTLWGVGQNANGQLGDGTTTDRRTPVQIASGVVVGMAGYNDTLYITQAQASANVSRLANLSVRTNIASGQTLIVGFVTDGAKPVLVRGVGPGMHDVFPQYFGSGDVMADPKLELYDDARVKVDENDNWNSSLVATMAGVGAFPLMPGSKDSAFVASINGPNTVHLKGTGNGVVLVDAYDTTTTMTPRLKNISARSQVGTGADILIAGFVIDGNATKTVLVRGIGPALRDIWGVTGVLADPKLEVIRQSDNAKVADNDNWDVSLATTFDQVGAYRFTAGSKDSALTVSLPPGPYTAQLSGIGGTTGDGVVEVYELP